MSGLFPKSTDADESRPAVCRPRRHAAWSTFALFAFLALATPWAFAADECADGLKAKGSSPDEAAQFDRGTSAFRAGDNAAAFESWKPLADNGNCLAQFNVGTMYLNGRGVSPNVHVALDWFRKAAEQGQRMAQFNLAEGYRVGTDIPKDGAQAIHWYAKAADQGLAVAQRFLAIAYDTGDGVQQDFGKAVTYYRLAAEQGDKCAQYNLGRMYAFGRGVPRDKVLAYFHVSTAASGCAQAKESAAMIAAKMTTDQMAETRQMIDAWKPGSPFPQSSATGQDARP